MGQAHNAGNPEEFLWSHEGIHPRVGEAPPQPPPAAEAEGAIDEMDQRRYPRIDLKLPVLYRVMGEEPATASQTLSPETPAKADNISFTGACLVLAERLPAGTNVALSIHLPEERQKISAVAKVVWSQDTDVMHHFLTGLHFIVLYKKTSTGTEYVTASLLQKFLHRP